MPPPSHQPISSSPIPSPPPIPFQIDRKSFTLKLKIVGGLKRNVSSQIILSEKGPKSEAYGAITMNLATKMETALVEAIKDGESGDGHWHFSDHPAWLTIQKASNEKGSFLRLTLSRLDGKGTLRSFFIPAGEYCSGWSVMASALHSLLHPTSIHQSKSLNPPIPPPPQPKPTTTCTPNHIKSKPSQTPPYPPSHPTPIAISSSLPCDMVSISSKIQVIENPSSSLIHPGSFMQLQDKLEDHLESIEVWKKGLVCTAASPIFYWKGIGLEIMEIVQTSAPFDIMPIDNLRAIILFEDQQIKTFFSQSSSIALENNFLTLSPWQPSSLTPHNHNRESFFNIGFHGLPLHLWSSTIITALANKCGDLVEIEKSTLTLSEISAARVKIRNLKGINAIPRWLNLETAVGFAGILVQIEDVVPRDLFWKWPSITVDPIQMMKDKTENPKVNKRRKTDQAPTLTHLSKSISSSKKSTEHMVAFKTPLMSLQKGIFVPKTNRKS